MAPRPRDSDDDGETIDREAGAPSWDRFPLEEAVAEFAATTGQAQRPARRRRLSLVLPWRAAHLTTTRPPRSGMGRPAPARRGVCRSRARGEGGEAPDPNDDTLWDVLIATSRRPRRAVPPSPAVPRAPSAQPIPETEETYLDLPLELDTVAVADGAAAGGGEPADLRRARLLDELEEARRADLPPRDRARILLAAGQACEAAGDPDAAGDCYDEALHLDETFAPAIRAHRRLLVLAGKYAAAARLLEQEVALAGPEERAPGRLPRGPVMAIGEEDLARVAFGELSTPARRRPLALAQLSSPTPTGGRQVAASSPRWVRISRTAAARDVPSSADVSPRSSGVKRGREPTTRLRADEGNRAAPGVARSPFQRPVADAARWFPAMLPGSRIPR